MLILTTARQSRSTKSAGQSWPACERIGVAFKTPAACRNRTGQRIHWGDLSSEVDLDRGVILILPLPTPCLKRQPACCNQRHHFGSPVFTDRHLDEVLSYFEAIHWRTVDAGKLQPSCSATAVFPRRGYWASKNTRQETSRDRFNGVNLNAEIAALEGKLAALGFDSRYCAGIRSNVTKGRDDAHALHLYRAALTRTLNAKARRAECVAVTD